MTIPAILLAAILTARFLPRSAFGAWLNTVAMHPLADRLSRIERRHIIFAIAMALIVLFASEVLAMAGPLDMGLVFVWDVSVYLDIAIATLTIAATTRGSGAARAIRATLASLAARLRRKPVGRTRRARRSVVKPAANDDEGHGREAVGVAA